MDPPRIALGPSGLQPNALLIELRILTAPRGIAPRSSRSERDVLLLNEGACSPRDLHPETPTPQAGGFAVCPGELDTPTARFELAVSTVTGWRGLQTPPRRLVCLTGRQGLAPCAVRFGGEPGP